MSDDFSIQNSNMVIKTQLSQKDFINASVVLTFKKISTKLLMAFGILYLLFTIYLAIIDPDDAYFTMFLVPLALIFAPVVMTCFFAILNYKTNRRSGEPLEYILGDDYLSIKGESFNTQLSWEKIYKVTQTKQWIFIWHNRLVANPISKQNLLASDIDSLKTTLDFHRVKNNL